MCDATFIGLCGDNVVTLLTPSSTIQCVLGPCQQCCTVSKIVPSAVPRATTMIPQALPSEAPIPNAQEALDTTPAESALQYTAPAQSTVSPPLSAPTDQSASLIPAAGTDGSASVPATQ